MTEKIRVLIVDDDVGILETLSDILEAEGYEVATAESGSKAIEQSKETPFDVALIDIVMPVMNGVQIFREIKKINPQIRAILMTGYAVNDLANEAFAEGAWKVLYKPLDLKQLMELLRTAKKDPIILVIDDDLEFCHTMKDILEDKGHRVFIAGDGEEALDLACKTSYDILLIDMKLPTINGLETYLAIRQFNPKAAAIMMTAYREETRDLVQEALDKNAIVCLYKPFAPEDMLNLIEGTVWGGADGSTNYHPNSR